jgi:uncharacterized protein YhaN
MRFDYLNLKAFGHFTDYKLSFDPMKNFTIIYGPNEAGKSTILRSINDFLYGFPAQTNDSFLHDNKKLRIAGQLKKKDGQTLEYIRRKGNKNTVLDINEKAKDEMQVNQFLNGISQDHFLNMFALNHDRLREGGESLLQSGGNLGESLFSAASGITVLRKVFEELEKKTNELYKKRGTTPHLNKLLIEEDNLKKEIAQYQLKIQAWKKLENTFNEGKNEIDKIITKIQNLRREQEKLKRIKLTLPKIARLKDLVQKLEELGEVPSLPDNIKELRQEAQQKLELGKKEKKKAEEHSKVLENELASITIPDGLIEQSVLIDALYRELQSFQNNERNLPVLLGEKERLQEEVISLMKEIDVCNANLEKIDMYHLPAEKKETIRELCKQKPLLDQEMSKIESELNELEDELELKVIELNKLSNLPNISKLEAVIDRVKRGGDIEKRIRDLTVEYQQLEKQIQSEIRLLPLWNGTYKELLELPVTCLNETIKKFAQDQADLLQKQQKIKDMIINQEEAIERYEERIRAIESLTEIPSEENLLTARNLRDQGWHLIKTKLETGIWEEGIEAFTKGEKVETVYEDTVRNADDIADKMRLEASKVGEKNKCLSDIESCRTKIEELKNKEFSINEKLVEWENAWKELWEPLGLIPLSPDEMREWLEKYNKIIAMVQDYQKSEAFINELKEQKQQFKQALIKALSEFVQVSENQTVDELLNLAEEKYKKIQTELNKKNNLNERISEIKGKIRRISNNKKDITSKLKDWNINWIAAVQGTNISENTSVAVAESLVERYENCAKAYDELKKVEKEIEILQGQISDYRERVKDVLLHVSHIIDSQNTEIAVNKLYEALQKAQQDLFSKQNIENQLKKLKSDIERAIFDIESANSTLNSLFVQAQCNTVEELEKVEQSFEQMKKYRSDKQALEEDLLQIGNGLSLEQIMTEAESIDQDSLQGEIDEIARKLEEFDLVRSQLEQAHGAIKKEYEEKIKGNNTATVEAEQRKESIHAKISSLTEQYIQIKLASTLLQKGIEYYRSQNQDPIIRRASELFAKLTLQSFSGLTVDYDEKDQPILMGIRAENGERVAIEGMSDGTKDQLYLSLRIASIEKYATENEPLPFIVDDILVHFDDFRSKETLRVLLELSRETQIIFFTHHARLVEIMKEVASDNKYQLIEIQSNAMVEV